MRFFSRRKDIPAANLLQFPKERWQDPFRQMLLAVERGDAGEVLRRAEQVVERGCPFPSIGNETDYMEYLMCLELLRDERVRTS